MRGRMVMAAMALAGAAGLARYRRRHRVMAPDATGGTLATPPRPPGDLERTGPTGDPSGDGLAPAADDAVLTDRVRSALGHHPLGSHVNVNVEFGTVVLRGEVPGDDEILDLGAAAEAVEGVLRVDNRLHRHGGTPPMENPTG